MKCWREEGTLRRTSVPFRGSRNTLCRFITLGKRNKIRVDGAIGSSAGVIYLVRLCTQGLGQRIPMVSVPLNQTLSLNSISSVFC